MKPTIILDAGHGGFDNGATYNGRREKDDTLELAMLVGNQLQMDGYPVVYTRTSDLYQRPTQKAQIANNSNGDFFVSIHRNASPQANQYSGVETLVYQDSGVPAEMARAVNQELSQVGFQNLGVSVRPELAVLRRTRMPAILVEAGFINTDADNALFDEKKEEIARAIARGIEKGIGETEMDPGTKPMEHYGVQVGLFRRYENAWFLQNQLMEEGYQARIKDWKDYFAVVVGEEEGISGAQALERRLRADGYDTLIVTLP